MRACIETIEGAGDIVAGLNQGERAHPLVKMPLTSGLALQRCMDLALH